MTVSPALLASQLPLSLNRGAGRLTHLMFRRLKQANLPLLFAFMSALVMFLRALSGAGYIEDLPASDAFLSRNAPLNLTSAAHVDLQPHAPGSFKVLWTRLKDDFSGGLLDCPPELSPSGARADASTSPSDRQHGVKCLKQRFSSAVHARRSFLKGKAVAKQETTFEVRIPQLPSLPSLDSFGHRQSIAMREEATARPTAAGNKWRREEIVEGENREEEWRERDELEAPLAEPQTATSQSPPETSTGSQRRPKGFEVRRRPH